MDDPSHLPSRSTQELPPHSVSATGIKSSHARMRTALLLVLGISALSSAEIVPPGNVRVPESEKPSKPFIWSERRLLTAPELFDAPDEWIDRSLQWVDYILQTYPPSIPE